MDLLTFISTITGQIAWPFAGIIISILVYKRAPYLLNIIKQIKYKDFEMTFHEMRIDAEVIRSTLPIETGEKRNISNKLLALIKNDPEMALTEIWENLEEEIISLIQHNGLIRFTTPSRFIHQLYQLNKISEHELRLYLNLKQIRNQIIHLRNENKPTAQEVIEYQKHSNLLKRRLNAIKDEPGYISLEIKGTE